MRVSTSDDPRWTAYARDPEIDAIRRHIDRLVNALADIPGTDLPVMAEQTADETRETRVFTRGNWMEKEGPALTPDVPALFLRLNNTRITDEGVRHLGALTALESLSLFRTAVTDASLPLLTSLPSLRHLRARAETSCSGVCS